MPLALVLPVRFHLILRHPCTLLLVARLPVVVVVVVVAAAARVVRVHLHLDQVLFILSPAPHGRRLYLQVLVDRAHAPRVPSVLRSALLSRWHPDGAFWPKNMEISKGAACPALFFWRRGEKPRREEGESKEYETKGARSDGTVFLSEGSSRDRSVRLRSRPHTLKADGRPKSVSPKSVSHRPSWRAHLYCGSSGSSVVKV